MGEIVGPQALQGLERQRGMQAISSAEGNIQKAAGDPFKIALEVAKIGATNPGLERVLGPVFQTALTQSQIKKAFGEPGQQPTPPNQGVTGAPASETNAQETISPIDFQNNQNLRANGMDRSTPGPFNIMTPQQIKQASEEYGRVLNDPNAVIQRQQTLNNLNDIATTQREDLQKLLGATSHFPAEDLNRMMQVGSQFDPTNPNEWAQKTLREYALVKSFDDQLDRAFIPGLGSGLLGRDRESELKNLRPIVKNLIDAGLEADTRTKLANNYLTPTEIEEVIHPLTPQNLKSIEKLPKGIFKFNEGETSKAFTPHYEENKVRKENVPKFLSYDQAQIKAPEEMKTMKRLLSDFFLKNVDDKTSLLPLRDKIIKERDYDWRQFGPALSEAMQKGLKLNGKQMAELADINTNPPYESLPDIFRDWSRIVPYLRGNK